MNRWTLRPAAALDTHEDQITQRNYDAHKQYQNRQLVVERQQRGGAQQVGSYRVEAIGQRQRQRKR